jgi:hypothetical protein
MFATIHLSFTTLDWGVLLGYLLLTTLVGHRLAGRQSNIRDFFLAGRSLPWQAVSGSIIATEISALTFIGVPGMVFAAEGDFTYLQWAIGSVIARVIVGLVFVRVFYEREIYSPYDYMEHRLGRGARTMGTILFFLSAILGQSVRLLVTALILDVVIDVPWWEGTQEFWVCIFIIALFAVVWTWMGGMTTVIWTDVIQFGIFIFCVDLALPEDRWWLRWVMERRRSGWKNKSLESDHRSAREVHALGGFVCDALPKYGGVRNGSTQRPAHILLPFGRRCPQGDHLEQYRPAYHGAHAAGGRGALRVLCTAPSWSGCGANV